MTKGFANIIAACALVLALAACGQGSDTGGRRTCEGVDTATAVTADTPTTTSGDTGAGSGPSHDSVFNELERLMNKIADGDLLVPEEWAFFFDHIDHFDGYLTEGMGNVLYHALDGNTWYNEQMAETLNTLPPQKREHVLQSMIVLMSIDLTIDKNQYTWLQFVEKYPIFMGSPAAKAALEQVYDARSSGQTY